MTPQFKSMLKQIAILSLCGLIAAPAFAGEVGVDAGAYNKLNKEQKTALTGVLKKHNLLAKGDTLNPQLGFAPARPDTSTLPPASKAATCSTRCDSDATQAKAACLIAMFFGQKDTCEAIIGMVSATCTAGCIAKYPQSKPARNPA